MCVGGMVVARSVVDRVITDDLRDACLAMALRLGGWDTANSRTQPSRRRRDHGKARTFAEHANRKTQVEAKFGP